ncbi:MAG: branched-chain amino acid transport system substrate-binding protein [Acidimicrobiaceae bacterium]|nr:branched-chain amino acid transport system substrate-binding protein [Acidimicrobiaceae bacterium]
MRLRFTRIALALATATSLSFVGAVGLTTESASAATASPITIALVCTCSGVGAPTYEGVPGAFRARIDLQNANGGVNGHKISTLVFDDQTSPTESSTAVQEAVSHGVLGVVSVSALFFEGAKYTNQAGIPVTGSFQDGPEWGQQPNTNMFASDNGSVDPKYPVNTGIGKFLVSHGGNVVGSYGYSISPSSSRSAIGTVQSVIHAGGKQGVLDTTVPIGGANFTTPALVAKSKNVNGLFGAMDDNSNFALATSLKQAGVKLKAVVFPTGYEPAAITSPAWQDLQGDYFASLFRPFQLPNAATTQMKAALQKYDSFGKTQFPTFEQYEAWAGADLMIKGMQLAGKNPTSSAVITSLRNLKSYNANGLLPNPINYSTIFGHDPAKSCTWYLQAQSKGFVPVSSQPICGTDIPGTATATGS